MTDAISIAEYKKRISIRRKKRTAKRAVLKLVNHHLAFKNERQHCLAMWYEIIKKRAGFRSELSGSPGRQIKGDYTLNAHHIIQRGGSSNRVVFDLANGICITEGEHMSLHGWHGPVAQKKMQKKLHEYIGEIRWNYLQNLCHEKSTTPLINIKLMLDAELAKLEKR